MSHFDKGRGAEGMDGARGMGGGPAIDWHALVARREQDPSDDFPAWTEALEAFDRDPGERERALDADPLMLFRAAREGDDARSGHGADRGEIESMKAAVAQLRRARAVESSGEPSSTPAWSSSTPWQDREGSDPRLGGLARWLSAAALGAISLSALLLTGTDVGPESGAGLATLGDTSAVIAPLAARGTTLLPGFDPAAAESVEQLPLIEDLDPSMNLVMQLEVDGVSVVFLTPENPEPNPT